MQKKENSDDNTFVIEVCENCRTHNWNTRHDEAKYQRYANESKIVTKSSKLLTYLLLYL